MVMFLVVYVVWRCCFHLVWGMFCPIALQLSSLLESWFLGNLGLFILLLIIWALVGSIVRSKMLVGLKVGFNILEVDWDVGRNGDYRAHTTFRLLPQ